MSRLSVLKELPQVGEVSNGILARFQEKLTIKYQFTVKRLLDKAAAVSSDCRMALADRMLEYRQLETKIVADQKAICDSLGTTQESYENLKNSIMSLSEELLEKAVSLRESSIALYVESFDSLTPFVESSYSECEDILPQLPDAFADLLPRAVNSLNVNFLKMKQELIKTYYNIHVDVMNGNKSILDEFERRTVEWKDNRFSTLLNEARDKLNPNNPLDLSEFYIEFHQEQNKFTLCCRKLLQNVSLVTPPNNFAQDDLNKWWDEVEEILSLHKEFINQFISKVQVKVDERNNENSQYMTNLETELVTLKDESEASAAIASVNPLLRQTQKYNASMVEKLTKYWENRRDALRKSYEAIKNFMSPLISDYDSYVVKMRKLVEDAAAQESAADQQSEQLLVNYEKDLNEKIEEIKILVDPVKMKQRVDESKSILVKIENEYRDHYKKILTILEKQPDEIFDIYQANETNILTKIKMKKTENSKEFEENPSTARSTRGKQTPAGARNARRPAKGKGDNKQTITNAFSFTLDSGAKFEESEPLEIIPFFDEFTDEPETPQHGKGKGKPPVKKPVKPPPKPKKPGQKGKAEEQEDIEGPEFSVQDTIEKIDGNVAVSVFTPQNSNLTEWINSFRKIIIGNVAGLFSTEMKRISAPENKQRLVDQLNERLRTHAPRANAIEMNIAQARTLEVESRKVQLEKHFKHAVAQFNQSCANIESMIGRKKTTISDECEKLAVYITELNNQKSTSNFAVLNQNLHITEHQFMLSLESVKEDIKKEIDQFSSYTNASSERFINNIVGDENCPQEEKDMSNEYIGRMKQQVGVVIQQLHAKADTEIGEIENRHNEILKDFDSLIPLHKSDVAFIELLNGATQEAKSKFDTLLHRNKQREIEIDRSIQNVIDVQSETGEPQIVLTKQFEALDALRILLSKRATYLSLLHSPISMDPISFVFDLGGESSQKPQESQPKSDPKSKRPRSKRSNERTEKKSAKDVKQTKNQPAPVEEKTEGIVPFSTLIETIGTDFNSAVLKAASEFYSSLKGRKIPITRPAQIPPTQQELIDSMLKKWQDIISTSTEITEQSILRFRSQVISSATAARSNSKIIYDSFEKYYNILVVNQRSDIQTKFDVELKELNQEKMKNKALLTPALADNNNETQFADLVNSELDRSSKEGKLIMEFQGSIIDTEKRISQLFINQLPNITSLALQLFDKFILIDDLKTGPALGAKRKTMKELLKEQKRKEEGGPLDSSKNARSRGWPNLPSVMSPLSNSPTSEATAKEATGTSSRSGSRKKRRKPSEKTTVQASTDTKVEIDNGSSLQSLDTQLHRGTIVERNRCFEVYETNLKKRLGDFQEYTKSLINDMNAFTAHWKQCISQLKGEHSIFATQ